MNWCIHDRTALAEAEVEYENHTSPSIWVRFALTSDPAGHRSRAGGETGLGPDLDHHALDDSGQPGDRLSPEVHLCGGGGWRRCLHCRAGSSGGDGRGLRLGVAASAGELSKAQRMNGTVFRHPFLERNSLGILGDHVTLEQGTGAVHTAPGHGQEDFEIGRANGLPVYCPVDRRGPFLSRRRRRRDAAGRTDRQDRLGSQSDRHRAAEERWRAARRRARSSTAIRIAGAATIRPFSAPPSSGSSAWIATTCARSALDAIKTREVDSGVGRRAHVQHDRHAAGLVHLAPARVGRADHRVLLRRLPGAADGSQDSGSRGRAVPRAHVGHLVFEDRGRADGSGCEVRRSAAERRSAKKATFWMSGSIPDRSHLATLTPENHLPWPADMYLEGGDQYRGWFHSSLLIGVGLKGASPYRGCADHGWTLDARRPRDAQIQGQRDRARGDHQAIRRGTAAPVDRLGRFHRRRAAFADDPRPAGGGVSEAAQHVPLHARQSARFRSGDAMRCAPEEMLEIDRWILARAEDADPQLPRLV